MWPHDFYFRTWLRLTLPPFFVPPLQNHFFRSNIPKIALVLDMTLLDHRDFSSFFLLVFYSGSSGQRPSSFYLPDRPDWWLDTKGPIALSPLLK